MALPTSLRTRFLLAALAIAVAAPAFAQSWQPQSQTMPWQGGQPYPAAPMGQPYAPPPPPSPSYGNGGYTREMDDRHLNDLASRFYAVKPGQPHARGRLRELEREVKDFRDGLFTRNYDSRDIISDADRLQGRIAAQRHRLEDRGQAIPAPSPSPVVGSEPVPSPVSTQSTLMVPLSERPSYAPAPAPASSFPPPAGGAPMPPSAQPYNNGAR